MKKILIFVGLFLLIAAVAGFSQVRLDVNVSVPVYNGIQVPEGGIGDYSDYTFLLPELQLHYVFDMSVVRIGLGARLFTFIIESVVMPNAFVELNFNPLVINLSLSGGAAALFGLYSDVLTGAFIIPDLEIGFQVTEWFRVCGGVAAITNFQETDAYLYSFYLRARFSINFGENNE